MALRSAPRALGFWILGLAGCAQGSGDPSVVGPGVTVDNHRWFPIKSGAHAVGRALADGPIQCESCHAPSAESFADITCFGCHSHPREITDKLHGTAPTLPNYAYSGPACYSCHAEGAKVVPFLHTGIPTGAASRCAECHEPDAPFAALPAAGVDHAAIVALPSAGGPDCGSCHMTTSWQGASRIPTGAFDPARSLLVVAQIPTYQGAEISALTPRSETLTMPMSHDTAQIPAATLEDCARCHSGAATGNYRPGDLHASLRTLGLPQPTACLECHSMSASMPLGFVGPLAANPARSPASGPMKHDAVEWSAGAPTMMALVPQDCALCHAAPAQPGSSWATNGATPVEYHASLASAAVPQPAQCVDCHANSRPSAVLTRANATLPANASWSFDHTAAITKAECSSCHQASATSQFRAWSGGQFHLAGSASPTTCAPCHDGDRPTTTAGWQSPTYTRSPFDYVTNARAITHGAGHDCAMCHSGAGTGAWGGTHNWQGGSFSHDPATTPAGVTCRDCHMTQRPDLQPGTTAAAMALLLRGFDHSVAGTGECKGCHQATVTANRYVDYTDPTTQMLPGGDWAGAVNTPSDAFDPARSIVVQSQIPSYVATSIVSVTPEAQTLVMQMNHSSAQIAPPVLANCDNCHAGAASGAYYPGDLHSSLGNLRLPQPTACAECHLASAPVGFVGPIDASRAPPSGAMKHDAVIWNDRTPTAARAVTQDCGTCHLSPTSMAATWATNAARTTPARYHASITSAGAAQPASCLDCHANSRPSGILAPPSAALPAGVHFDHASTAATAECASCHARGSAPTFAAWTSGKFHLAGSATPSTCLPCHDGERPTSDAQWTSTTYREAPFDYGTTNNRTHGNGQDCVTCHAGPGTSGAWGGLQSWVGGRFTHGPGSLSASTCIVCHATQRPDLQPGTTAAAMAALLGFDHALSGTGDCFGCHQATVTAGTYARYTNRATGMLPNGDWMGGQSYPGSSVVTAPTQLITVTETTLHRSSPNNLVRSMTSISATFHNAMLHTSPAVAAPISAGPDANPDFNACWHCHQNTAGTVTSYAEGQFHSALDLFSATPGGARTPLPQPTDRCNDCHAQMRPLGIVQKGATVLQPMDHDALFTAAVTLRGARVSGVPGMDCSSCHASGGAAWSDGRFHPNIGAAIPVDCTQCHYPLMADRAQSDRTSGTTYAMHHASAALTFQNCGTCHTGALATVANISAAAWRPGDFHPHAAPQPSACLDCHAASIPGASTQSLVAYALPAGGTPTNAGQWMSHAASAVVGRDCVQCHASDARTAGSAWSRSASFHAAIPNPSTCQGCHGLTNGGGATAGVRNNLPSGLTSSNMLSTAIAHPTTGVPAGTRAQIDHSDINVRSHDCGFCHTQVGASTAPGVQGFEWAQASFHPNFTGANTLVMNGTTGRCSNCHMNVRPGAAFVAQDHSAFTANSMADCSSCHSIPGTGTLIAPNWLGAAGMPQLISIGGFPISRPPATAATTQSGVNNVPHPAVPVGVACIDCHATAAGGRSAHGYDHASPTINNTCNACHEAGSDLVASPWNGATAEVNGAGDTRPFTLASVTARFSGNTRNVTWPNHFYPVDCKECHLKPAGNGYVTTGTAYRTNTGAWGNNSASTGRNFPHNENVMSRPSTCLMCHNPIPN